MTAYNKEEWEKHHVVDVKRMIATIDRHFETTIVGYMKGWETCECRSSSGDSIRA